MTKEIPVFYSKASFRHNPPFEVFNGEKDDAAENVDRIINIIKALRKTDFANLNVTKLNSLAWVEQAHDTTYLEFLKEASEQSEEEGVPMYPSVHPYIVGSRATNLVAKRGLHVFDTYTPIMGNTYEVALESAACAVEGAKLIMEGESAVYALTRPPGHHAERAVAGGYCYVNNAAVAAEFFITKGAKKVAVFDFDFHHGNGTQDIFYQRADILVVNIHSRPEDRFPYFTGYKNEMGEAEGKGANYNFPLPLGVGDEEYHLVAKKAADIITKFGPDYLIASAGFDTHRDDPIGGFSLSTDYYRKLGRLLGSLNFPILTVQEGGYATEVLGENVVSYLKGLLDTK